MDSAEFSEWMAFYRLEPFGESWLETGVIASTLANTVRDPKKKKQPFEPHDFMPVPKKKETKKDGRLLHKVEMLNKLFGGKDLRNKDGHT